MICSTLGCRQEARGRTCLCATHYAASIRAINKNVLSTAAATGNFWKRVRKTPRCWNWIGNVGTDGYGGLSVAANPTKAHRYSWVIHHGPIPNGLQVLHKCDNRVCVNPDHLFLGTTQDNMLDRDRKNRQVQGERHPSAKLTAQQVIEIRRRFKNGCKKNGTRPLAREFGLSKSTMTAVVRGQTWKGVLKCLSTKRS